MHAWESIQKTLDYIEDNLANEMEIENLADIAALSVFYYQRLFARLVKKPVREYIKLRRLASSSVALASSSIYITDLAIEYGFGNRETFSRAFKETYGISPSQYKDKPVGLSHFDKPNLLLNYVMIDEGVPLVTEGIVLEYHRATLDKPVDFLGVNDIWIFQQGKMHGERPAVSEPSAVWDKFFDIRNNIPRIPDGRQVGVSYKGDAPDGYSTYFVGAEVEAVPTDTPFDHWQLPAREYVVCKYEAEDFDQLLAHIGKMMKFTRSWLKEHGLTADGFFPEVYFNQRSYIYALSQTFGLLAGRPAACAAPASQGFAYMEMWIPFRMYRQEGRTP